MCRLNPLLDVFWEGRLFHDHVFLQDVEHTRKSFFNTEVYEVYVRTTIMALPIGRTTSRGILPDRDHHFRDYHTPDSYFHIPNEFHHNQSLHSLPTKDNPLFTYLLFDGSIVHTTHSSFQKLFVSLQRQLNYHVDHVNNDLPSISHHTSSTHTHLSTVTRPTLSITNYSTPGLNIAPQPNGIILHSPKSVYINQQDVFASDVQSRQLYNKNIALPFFSKNDSRPLIHHITKKNSLLTTRLLYPNTSLPLTFDFIMPIFKNRLHRTNALRKLFEDAQIGDLTYANAQILHQRVSSMSLKPVLPGYHLEDALDVEDMRHDLFTIRNHLEDELKKEKAITSEEKACKYKTYNEIVECARSLLPEEMILDINFPVTSMIGLTHHEAISLLRHYYDAHGVDKTPQFFKKRDTTFYLNEIFGILDFIHSEHTKSLSPLLTQPPSDDDQLPDKTHDPASLVTPLPPSPSKKRKTDEDHTHVDNITNINNKIFRLRQKNSSYKCNDRKNSKKP